MKVAVAFVFAALSCFFGTSCANYGKVPSNDPIIPRDCLEKLLKIDVPGALEKLQNLLCLYAKGKKSQNIELYKKFLRELHEALISAGCTVDQILSTPQFLEKVGDQVGKVADQLGLEVFKLVEELGLSDIVLKVLCDLLGETLLNVSKTLAGINLNLGKGLLSGGAGGLLPLPLPLLG